MFKRTIFAYSFLVLCLTGCWWTRSTIPSPASTNSLQGAEDTLDHLTDKRDSRVAAAVIVAKERTDDKIVSGELSVAEAMLPAPTKADLDFAKNRAVLGDGAFYAKQIEVSRQLALALVKANEDYSKEKIKKEEEYKAGIKQKEMELEAERLARSDDKWTWTGIFLLVSGAALAFLSPLPRSKIAGVGMSVLGICAGSMPFIMHEAWFKYSVIGFVAIVILIALIKYFTLNSGKAQQQETAKGVTELESPQK